MIDFNPKTIPRPVYAHAVVADCTPINVAHVRRTKSEAITAFLDANAASRINRVNTTRGTRWAAWKRLGFRVEYVMVMSADQSAEMQSCLSRAKRLLTAPPVEPPVNLPDPVRLVLDIERVNAIPYN